MATSITIQDIFLSDLDFCKAYISLHYPFTEQEVLQCQQYLRRGNAHYSAFMSDTDAVYSPEIGLCFNKNIQWTDTLRRSWHEVGIWNPFVGAYDGLEDGKQAEWDEVNQSATAHNMIPLDVHEELHKRERCYFDSAHATGELNDLFKDETFTGFLDREVLNNNSYGRLTDTSFVELYHRNKLVILYNDSVWQNTLQYLLTKDFMQQAVSLM